MAIGLNLKDRIVLLFWRLVEVLELRIILKKSVYLFFLTKTNCVKCAWLCLEKSKWGSELDKKGESLAYRAAFPSHLRGIQNIVATYLRKTFCLPLSCSHWVYRFLDKQKNTRSQVKGQIISECPYEIIVYPKIATKKFPRFLPKPLRRGQIKKIKALYYTN